MKKKIKKYLTENNITSILQLQNHIEELRYKKDRTVEETQAFFDLVGVVCNHKSDLDWYFFNLSENKEVDKAMENIRKSISDTGLIPFTSPIQVFYYNRKDEDLKRLQEIMDDEHRPTNWEVLQKYIGRSRKDKDYSEELRKIAEEEYLKEVRQDILRPASDITETIEKMKEAIEEGIKETEGKLDHSEINLSILDLMAERFMANKHKYPLGNSKKEIDPQSLVQAMFRHIVKMIKPPVDDPETFKDHLAAVLCGASMVLDQLEIKENKL